MGLDLYARIEGYLNFEEEVQSLHAEFLSIILGEKLDNILDVGCGQGAFLQHLNANNLNAFGIDLSAEQIKICQQKGITNVAAIPLEEVTQKYDCATAIFDVVNYVPAEFIEEFFKTMSLVLNQGGFFIFDVNSYFGFDEVAQGTLTIDDEDQFIAIDAIFENRQLQTDITLFSRQKNGQYEKENDSIVQTYHSIEFLKEKLEVNGFNALDITPFHLHSEDDADKLIFVCQKI